MQIKDNALYSQITDIIKALYGPEAVFRAGQYEAVEATLLGSRTLVVQKTGWGESLVYFACTKILRTRGRGVTMVVSPLLVLMQNQIEAAHKLGLKCDALNSTVADRRGEIINSLKNNALDLILVTPETLFRDDLQEALKDITIGLFVIDEAHCISDWGHDFRLDYGNLYKVLGRLPKNVPILATTATANDRVVADLARQLGDQVYISRGPLTRESLAVQVIKLHNRAERFAWILQYINSLPGSGIIYCLTQRDCDFLSDFLNKNGIKAMSYYSRSGESELINTEAEALFQANKIKAIVATIKLGMGYDKSDIGFIIHFQQPANIVSYYQQIGRAGRNGRRAYAILMSGSEDSDIIDYFINTAFPTYKEANDIIGLLEKANGLSLNEIQAGVNMKRARIEKALSFMANEGYLNKEKSKYYLTPKKYVYNHEHYDAVTQIRKKEKEQIGALINTDLCYSRFIVNCLDDAMAHNCGICANCIGKPLLPVEIDMVYLEKALLYINSLLLEIEPRKQWATTQMTKQTKLQYMNELGLCLSKYGDVGYGELVKKDKYSKPPRFRDELVGKSSTVLKPIIAEQSIRAITCVPSLRGDIVSDFARRLADSCGIRFVSLLSKKQVPQQKEMQNSSHQCENALQSFYIDEGITVPDRVILVDDIVDSRWTLTVCGYRLMEAGCKMVFPFTLADSSQRED